MRRDRHCGHVWCLSTHLWREVKVTARLVSVYRYFGKLVLVPFRYFSIDIYRNIDIFDNTTVHTRFILIRTLKRIHCCKSRFSLKDKGPRNNIPKSTFSPKKQSCNLDRYSFVYVSSLQGELLFVSVMEQITLKNSVLVVKKTAWFCSRQCPEQNEIIQKKKKSKIHGKLFIWILALPRDNAVTHLSSDGGVT